MTSKQTRSGKRPVHRFLTVCLGGNVRSVGLAAVLKLQEGQEAIAVGALFTSPATFRLLISWAQYVVVMAEEVIGYLPPFVVQSRKLRLVDVGPDRFGNPFHQELQDYFKPLVADWALRAWKI